MNYETDEYEYERRGHADDYYSDKGHWEDDAWADYTGNSLTERE